MRFMQIESVLQTKNRSEPAKNRFTVALVGGIVFHKDPLWLCLPTLGLGDILFLPRSSVCPSIHPSVCLSQNHVCSVT